MAPEYSSQESLKFLTRVHCPNCGNFRDVDVSASVHHRQTHIIECNECGHMYGAEIEILVKMVTKETRH